MLPSLLLLIVPLLASGFNIFEPVHNQSQLTEAAVATIEQFYVAHFKHIFVRHRASNPNSALRQRDIINQILTQIQSRITVQLETHRAEVFNESRAQNVFLVDDFASFRLISQGMKVRTYDYTGWFLVIVSDTSSNSNHTVREIIADLWSHYIVNVGILITHADTSDSVDYFTYFPYGNGHCEDVRPRLWNTFTNGQYMDPSRQLFPNKLANFYGCSLKLATFHIPPFMILRYGIDQKLLPLYGLDGIVIRALSRQLNFTLEVIVVDPPEWGITARLGYSTGISRYIRDRVVNFSIGYWSVTNARNRYIASTFPYYTSLVTTMVPPGEPYSPLEQLILPFQYIIWSCVGTILAVAVVVIAVIQCQTSRVQSFVFGQAIITPVLNTFNVFFGGALTRLPGRNFSRTLLAFWLFYGIVIRTSYTGSLFKFLRLQPNKTTPLSLPEYVKAGYQIRMSRNYSYIFDEFPQYLPSLKQTSLNEFFAHEMDELQRPGTRYVTLAPIEMISFENRELTKRGQFLRTTKHRVYTSKLGIYTQRFAPVLQPFNKLLGQLDTAGLINQWASIFHQPVFLADPVRASEPTKLSIAQVLGCFQLLTAGLLVSFVVFGVELAVGYRKRETQMKTMFHA
ncbi:uncharacterized protein LOC131428390 [Malaya genurostris]|uniref:uncharacterized protein LOC131428390 n=1 Tax=Malaya genurostris TaxID=325434 RepID=UPI0026F39516|nr:uncharacterized protein LOC131428390 [Malaya genurostris]